MVIGANSAAAAAASTAGDTVADDVIVGDANATVLAPPPPPPPMLPSLLPKCDPTPLVAPSTALAALAASATRVTHDLCGEHGAVSALIATNQALRTAAAKQCKRRVACAAAATAACDAAAVGAAVAADDDTDAGAKTTRTRAYIADNARMSAITPMLMPSLPAVVVVDVGDGTAA